MRSPSCSPVCSLHWRWRQVLHGTFHGLSPIYPSASHRYLSRGTAAVNSSSVNSPQWRCFECTQNVQVDDKTLSLFFFSFTTFKTRLKTHAHYTYTLRRLRFYCEVNYLLLCFNVSRCVCYFNTVNENRYITCVVDYSLILNHDHSFIMTKIWCNQSKHHTGLALVKMMMFGPQGII